MSQPTIAAVAGFLKRFAPLELAEEWDNVGLLVGDAEAPVGRVMTCLTLTPASAREAAAEGAGLVVAHHPLPFRPLKRVTTDATASRLLWNMIRAGVAVYSPHTAFDSAAAGVNQLWAEGLGLTRIEPITPKSFGGQREASGEASAAPAAIGGSGSFLTGVGAGRLGVFAPAVPLAEAARRVKAFLGVRAVMVTGPASDHVERVAIACGSGGELLAAARRRGCQLFLTGEANFHTCLEAEANEVALMQVGHYASERFAVERLAGVLGEAFPQVVVWASREEADPLRRM